MKCQKKEPFIDTQTYSWNTSISIETTSNWNLLKNFNSIGNRNGRTKEFSHVSVCTLRILKQWTISFCQSIDLSHSHTHTRILQINLYLEQNFSKKCRTKFGNSIVLTENRLQFLFSHISVAHENNWIAFNFTLTSTIMKNKKFPLISFVWIAKVLFQYWRNGWFEVSYISSYAVAIFVFFSSFLCFSPSIASNALLLRQSECGSCVNFWCVRNWLVCECNCARCRFCVTKHLWQWEWFNAFCVTNFIAYTLHIQQQQIAV